MELSVATAYLARVAYIVFGSSAAAVNGVIVAAMIHGKTFANNHCFLMLTVLAASDVILGSGMFLSGVINTLAYHNVTHAFSQQECLGIYLLFSAGSPMGQVMTLVIAAERLYAIALPHHYRTYGGNVSKIVAGSVVILSVVLAGFSYLGSSVDETVIFCGTPFAYDFYYNLVHTYIVRMPSSFGAIILYILVLYKLKQQQRKIATMSQADSEDFKAQVKATSTVTKLILIFFLTTVVAYLIILSQNISLITESPTILNLSSLTAGMLLVINPLLTALLIIRNDTIGGAVRKMLPCFGTFISETFTTAQSNKHTGGVHGA